MSQRGVSLSAIFRLGVRQRPATLLALGAILLLLRASPFGRTKSGSFNLADAELILMGERFRFRRRVSLCFDGRRSGHQSFLCGHHSPARGGSRLGPVVSAVSVLRSLFKGPHWQTLGLEKQATSFASRHIGRASLRECSMGRIVAHILKRRRARLSGLSPSSRRAHAARSLPFPN